jgi:hypothetical protein
VIEVEACPRCGEKIRNGECRECGYRPSRTEEIGERLLYGNDVTVDDLCALATQLPTGAQFDELRYRLNALSERETVEFPAGLTIVLGLNERYRLVENGDDIGSDKDTYSEALAEAREHVSRTALPGDSLAVPVRFISEITGLVVECPLALNEIAESWERPPFDMSVWASYAGSVVEAFCWLCGEICNPTGRDDSTHGQRQRDEQPCGGPLQIVGGWR